MDAKKKSKPLSAGGSITRKPRKHNPAFEKFIEAMEKNGGWIKYKEMPSFRDGITHLPFNLLLHVRDLQQLASPDNPTPYMVEVVRIGHTSYLHLVKKPPRDVLDAMATTPYSASNDISEVMEALSKSFPSKPAAKTPPAGKARKALLKPSAKKPEPAIEETPEQKKKAARLKNLAIAMEIYKARKGRRE
jgi:hypothetical protein